MAFVCGAVLLVFDVCLVSPTYLMPFCDWVTQNASGLVPAEVHFNLLSRLVNAK